MHLKSSYPYTPKYPVYDCKYIYNINIPYTMYSILSEII